MDKLEKKYSKNPIYGDIYTIPNLKALLDDLVNEYFMASGYKRSFFYENIRTALGISTLILTLFTTYLSLFYKFAEVKHLIKMAVYAYFALTLLFPIIKRIEGNRYIYEKFQVSSRIDSLYTYILLLYRKNRVVPEKYTRSIFELYDENGALDHELLLRDIEKLFMKEKTD